MKARELLRRLFYYAITLEGKWIYGNTWQKAKTDGFKTS